MRSSNAASDAFRVLTRKGRISDRPFGRTRAYRILKPLTAWERDEHRLDIGATLGSYDTGMKCIVCQVARLFDGITQCLECRDKCDKTNP